MVERLKVTVSKICFIFFCSEIPQFFYPRNTGRCILPISGQSSFFPPLFFDDVGKLLNTATVLEVNEDLVLNGGEQILLSCSPNFFRNYQQSRTLNATCVDGLTLRKCSLPFTRRLISLTITILN